MQSDEPIIDFSVGIRAYNSEIHLPQLLDCLKYQKALENIRWEVIVVDNNSHDKTPNIVAAYQETWLSGCPLKYYVEERQGAAFARLRLVREAKGHLIGFLDDDNLPSDNWIAEAYAFGKIHKTAGAWGSRIYPEFEADPPLNFREIQSFFAIIQWGDEPFKMNRRNGLLPPGAGLVARKQALSSAYKEKLILTGPVGSSIREKSEDIEILRHIQNAGWEIWYNPKMTMYHRIQASRLKRNYLIPFFRGCGRSRYRIRMLRFNSWQRPFALVAYTLHDVVQISKLLLKYKLRINKDIIVDCKMTYLLNSLISPWFLYRQKRNQSINH